MTAGRAIVDLLQAEGVRFVFGLPGGHVLGIYDTRCDTPGSPMSWRGTHSDDRRRAPGVPRGTARYPRRSSDGDG